MFCAGGGLIIIGLYAGRAIRYTILPIFFVLAGVAVLAASVVLGLVFAYMPALTARARDFRGVVITDRYVLDELDMVRDLEEMSPDQRFTPMVRLRTQDGQALTLVTTRSVYEFLGQGQTGTARVRGDHLVRFTRGG